MSLERNKAAIRRLYQEVVNEGNLDAMEEVFTYDVEVNTSAIPEDPEPEYGVERLRPAFIRMLEAFPGLHAAIDDLFGEGDRVVARVHFYGHLPGETDAPEGKRRLWTSVDVFPDVRRQGGGAVWVSGQRSPAERDRRGPPGGHQAHHGDGQCVRGVWQRCFGEQGQAIWGRGPRSLGLASALSRSSNPARDERFSEVTRVHRAQQGRDKTPLSGGCQ